MNVTKVINTVRYMTPRQWKYRLYYTARNKLQKRKPKLFDGVITPIRMPLCFALNIDNEDSLETAKGILSNRIPGISGKIIEFEGDWDLKGETYRIVCFRLNSFRWLLDLSDAYQITGDKKYIDKGFALIENWQQNCVKDISGDKWNPYVIAERIVNWIGFVSEYGNEDDLKKTAGSIYSQGTELKDSLEFQLGANHLLSEAKALVFSGLFLNNNIFYETGKQLLINEAGEQFYPDGGHYEQSLSYHIESLQQYFETYAVMKQAGKDTSSLTDLMRKPYQFLNGMIGVNGRIPLFNDAAYDYPFYDAADFLSTAEYIFSAPPHGKAGSYARRWSRIDKADKEIDWNTKILYENTGFIHYPFIADGKSYSFFMDCGNNGPDYNLGHAHADALSILLCSEDKEILVDSGVFTYQPGNERNACRATNAHNTVEVDGKNSAEVWAAFRVARRGHAQIINFSTEDGLSVKASHDGYTAIFGSPVIHTRSVQIKQGMIEIIDTVESSKFHRCISRFHISPECRVTLLNNNTCRIDNITVCSEKEIRIADCKISGMFGKTADAKCLEIDFTDNLKTIFELSKDVF